MTKSPYETLGVHMAYQDEKGGLSTGDRQALPKAGRGPNAAALLFANKYRTSQQAIYTSWQRFSADGIGDIQSWHHYDVGR